ncbi:MAG: hypothetical protein V1794_18755, partial [Candidatus Glassbacteria bacterium]
IEYYNKALKSADDSQKGTIFQQIGYISQREQSNFSQAIEAYTNALKYLENSKKTTVYFLRGTAYHDYANELDYSFDQDADMDELIERGQMTVAKADQAADLYRKAVPDLEKVTSGALAKSAQAHIQNIGKLQVRLTKIKQQIDYFEKTK